MVDWNDRGLADLVRLNCVRDGGRVPQTSLGFGTFSDPSVSLPRCDSHPGSIFAVPGGWVVILCGVSATRIN